MVEHTAPLNMISWSTEKVGEWLTERGFDDDIKQVFIGEEMDGEALVQSFTTCSGPDCLKDLVPTYGKRIKVYMAIKRQLEDEEKWKEPSPCDIIPLSPIGSPGSFSHKSPESNSSLVTGRKKSISNSPSNSISTVSVATLNYESQHEKSRLRRKRPLQDIPDPFPIPVFRESTETNLSNGRLADDDRKYMVRVLATMLCSYVQRPSMCHCKLVATSLVNNHKFLKEHDSWTQFIYTICQNTNRGQPSVPPIPKKPKTDNNEKHAYASIFGEGEDEVSQERNKVLLQRELVIHPKSDLTSLIRRTFPTRRQWILNDTIPVKDIISEYPHLSKPVHVAFELDLIMDVTSSYEAFCYEWPKWECAIIKYATASKSLPKELRQYLSDSVDGDEKILLALRSLTYFMATKLRKKKEIFVDYCVIPCILMQAPRGTPLTEVVDKTNNHPHILRFVDGDEDIPPQYFIVVEQDVVMESTNFTSALYHLISTHYIFNISYNVTVKDVLFFIQRKVANFDDKSFKKSAVYLSVESGIECYLD